MRVRVWAFAAIAAVSASIFLGALAPAAAGCPSEDPSKCKEQQRKP